MDTDFVEIGTIPVDSGMVVIGDPTYVQGLDPFEAVPLGVTDDYGQYGEHALFSRSGIGDGSYKVSIRYEEVPGWGRRVAELRVVFVDDDARALGAALLEKFGG